MDEELTSVLNYWGQIIVDNYRNNISSHRATGNLSNTITFRTEGTNDEFRIVISLASYYVYLENGRKPGKMPPISSIVNWIRVKGITPKPYKLPSGKQIIPSEQSLAYLIARSIGKNGLPVGGQMKKTIEEIQEALITDICRVLATNISLQLIQPFK